MGKSSNSLRAASFALQLKLQEEADNSTQTWSINKFMLIASGVDLIFNNIQLTYGQFI